MKQELVNKEKMEVRKICNEVRELVKDGDYEECNLLLKRTIGKYPHAPEPHNFFGILLEKEGNHLLAMKHFRVAWALDATYLPARHNLDLYGTFYAKGNIAFDESDCPQLVEENTCKIEYDNKGVGRVVRRNKK
ncbi:hypothetical protein [Clostridium vincentii]|uniref:Tetratricopeptide repeat protein n=1 Tax=Clostridium vincentii TaxID=52704 RepID=A0A2T0BD94_9CLOT|nr:hypothetical protein [Clostridium vincentii]PRR81858.1 hypothetical protein CLVI_22040 [Clostridium vincentii]